MATLKEKSYFTSTEPYVFVKIQEHETPDREEQDKIRAAMQLKDDGNDHFTANNYVKAIESYGAVIAALQMVDINNCKRELAICYENRAAANEHLDKLSLAIEDATKAIETDGTFGKAYFRRAQAYANEKKFYSALQDTMWACILSQFRNKCYIDKAMELSSRFGKLFDSSAKQSCHIKVINLPFEQIF